MKARTKYITTRFLMLFGLTLCLFSACDKENMSIANQADAFVKYYGGDRNQGGYDILIDNDGSYLVFGWTNSFGRGNRDFYLVKTDKEGNQLWSNTYGTTKKDEGRVIIRSNDGGFILFGSTEQSNLEKTMIVKVDAEGGMIDSLIVNDNSGSAENPGDITIDPLGGYIFTTSTTVVDTTKPDYNPFSDNRDILVVKLDNDLNEVWRHTFGFPKNEFSTGINVMAGHFLVTGYTNLSDPNRTSFLAAKFEFGSQTPAEVRAYGSPFQKIETIDATATSAGDIAVIGYHRRSSLPDPVDAHQIVFQRIDIDEAINPATDTAAFVHNSFIPVEEIPYSIIELDNGNFAVSGIRKVNESRHNIFLMELDQNGGYIRDILEFGGSGFEEAGAVKTVPGGGFVITGKTDQITNRVMTLIKTNSRGELAPE